MPTNVKKYFLNKKCLKILKSSVIHFKIQKFKKFNLYIKFSKSNVDKNNNDVRPIVQFTNR